MDGIKATIQGLPDLRAALGSIPAKLRVRALRNALTAGARVVRDAARRSTPVLKLSTVSGSAAYRRGIRKPGTVKNAISVRTSKLARKKGDVGVFVNVRPAKSGARGAKSPTDPFYWRWLNWGWNPNNGARSRGERTARRQQRRALNAQRADKRKPGARFLEAGASMLPQALQVFLQKIGPAIAKLNQPKAPAP